mmetsp:Transcript_24288/g.62266  ORF Transcript_24288/g.62266 Transcript_24288/m.62266 type:complete len:352 (+) Transcript_24288:429-1484(+)
MRLARAKAPAARPAGERPRRSAGDVVQRGGGGAAVPPRGGCGVQRRVESAAAADEVRHLLRVEGLLPHVAPAGPARVVEVHGVHAVVEPRGLVRGGGHLCAVIAVALPLGLRDHALDLVTCQQAGAGDVLQRAHGGRHARKLDEQDAFGSDEVRFAVLHVLHLLGRLLDLERVGIAWAHHKQPRARRHVVRVHRGVTDRLPARIAAAPYAALRAAVGMVQRVQRWRWRRRRRGDALVRDHHLERRRGVVRQAHAIQRLHGRLGVVRRVIAIVCHPFVADDLEVLHRPVRFKRLPQHRLLNLPAADHEEAEAGVGGGGGSGGGGGALPAAGLPAAAGRRARRTGRAGHIARR